MPEDVPDGVFHYIMTVRIALEGRIRDKNAEAFVLEYKKRLSPFFDFEVAELGAGNSRGLDRLIKTARPEDVFIGLDASGRKLDSVSFASWFDGRRLGAKSITFIIGEAEGLSDMARGCASELISLSELTLSYRVSLMVAAEQIYRAMTIITGHPYHK